VPYLLRIAKSVLRFSSIFPAPGSRKKIFILCNPNKYAFALSGLKPQTAVKNYLVSLEFKTYGEGFHHKGLFIQMYHFQADLN
jgi:hypothetical protein